MQRAVECTLHTSRPIYRGGGVDSVRMMWLR